jgi:hypothetical protein
MPAPLTPEEHAALAQARYFGRAGWGTAAGL